MIHPERGEKTTYFYPPHFLWNLMLELAVSFAPDVAQNTCISNSSARIQKLDMHLKLLKKNWKCIIISGFCLHYNCSILKCAKKQSEVWGGLFCFVLHLNWFTGWFTILSFRELGWKQQKTPVDCQFNLLIHLLQGMASGQSLAQRPKAESCEDAGTWRNVVKLLLSGGSESFCL